MKNSKKFNFEKKKQFLKKGDSTIYIANVLMGLMGTMDAIVQGSTYGLAGNFVLFLKKMIFIFLFCYLYHLTLFF